MFPSYIETYKSGELEKRIKIAYNILKSCTICPLNCKVNRLKGQLGACKTGELPIVSDYMPHFGEEAPLVGERGSGAIFFSYCNLRCVFCQTYEISHLGHGRPVSIKELAGIMITLQKEGCHNINLITPSHVVPQIMAALALAIEDGLNIPLVYNTGGYDSIDTLRLLEGVIDIYMPDFKYWDEKVAERFSKVKDYPRVVKAAIKEMHRQVGDLILDERGIAKRGLLVRHLVLPDGLAGTRDVLRFLAKEVSPHTYVNIMGHYRPCGEAQKYPPLNRRIKKIEYEEAIRIAREEGISRIDQTHTHLYPMIFGE